MGHIWLTGCSLLTSYLDCYTLEEGWWDTEPYVPKCWIHAALEGTQAWRLLQNTHHLQSRVYALPCHPSPALSKFPQRVQRVLHKTLRKAPGRVTAILERLQGCALWTEDLLWGWALLLQGYRGALERPRPRWRHFTARTWWHGDHTGRWGGHGNQSGDLQQPARPICPWGSPGKHTGVGCDSLLKGIFPIQG